MHAPQDAIARVQGWTARTAARRWWRRSPRRRLKAADHFGWGASDNRTTREGAKAFREGAKIFREDYKIPRKSGKAQAHLGAGRRTNREPFPHPANALLQPTRHPCLT